MYGSTTLPRDHSNCSQLSETALAGLLPEGRPPLECKLVSEFVPLWVNAEVLRHILVPEVKALVPPLAGCEMAGQDKLPNQQLPATQFQWCSCRKYFP